MAPSIRSGLIVALAGSALVALQLPRAAAQGCPELLGRWPYGSAETVAVAGSTAYVGSGTALLVVDVGDPAAPVLVGSFDTAGVAQDLTLAHGSLVLADETTGLALFDDRRGVLCEEGFGALGSSAWSRVHP